MLEGENELDGVFAIGCSGYAICAWWESTNSSESVWISLLIWDIYMGIKQNLFKKIDFTIVGKYGN